MTDTTPKRPKYGPLILLAIIAFAVLTFVLGKCGIGVIKTTEDSEIIDKPHKGY
jgi:hypothetical protein